MAKLNNATTSQIALAWVLRQPGVIAIPKANKEKHVRDNARSIHVKLTNEDLSILIENFRHQVQEIFADAVTCLLVLETLARKQSLTRNRAKRYTRGTLIFERNLQ